MWLRRKLDDLTRLLARLTEDAPPIEVARARRRGQAPARRGHRQPRTRPSQSAAHRRAARNSRICWPATSTFRRAARRTRPPGAAARRSPAANRTDRAGTGWATGATPYCGTTPSRPTLTRAVSNVPSGFFVAAGTVTAAPGLSSLRLPISYRTIGTSGPTTIFFSPSRYFTVIVGPSTPVTAVPAVPLVMVLLGAPSQGRCPSPVPR